MVVFPTPGGPQRMREGMLFASTARRRALPGPMALSCPATSSRERGRIRSASGASRRGRFGSSGKRLTGAGSTAKRPPPQEPSCYHQRGMKCSQCLMENAPTASTCRNCGRDLRKGPPGLNPPPAPPKPPPALQGGLNKGMFGHSEGWLSSDDDPLGGTPQPDEAMRAKLFGEAEDLSAGEVEMNIGAVAPGHSPTAQQTHATGLPPEAFAPYTEQWFRAAVDSLPDLASLRGSNGHSAVPSDDFFEVTPSGPKPEPAAAPPVGNVRPPAPAPVPPVAAARPSPAPRTAPAPAPAPARPTGPGPVPAAARPPAP